MGKVGVIVPKGGVVTFEVGLCPSPYYVVDST